MSIMDKIVEDSGGTMKKENINGKMKCNRKNGRTKSDSPISLLRERAKDAGDVKHEEIRNGKNRKESEKRSDSPGMDLSVFQPRGKRKCVLQNETKKQRDGWWSDDETDDNDEDDGEEGDERDDLADSRKSGKENKIKKKSLPSKKKKKSTKNDDKSDNDDKVSANHHVVQCYVFSTGMANRAGHAVTKGIYDSITSYHHAQKWNTPYLCAEVHCRPFNASVEEEEYKDLADGVPLLRREETKPDVRTSYETGMNNHVTDNHRQDQALSVNSWQKETVIQAAKRLSRAKPTENEISKHTKVDESSFHQANKHSSVKTEGGMEKSDSEQSPQTVPRFSETNSNDKHVVTSAPSMFPVNDSTVRDDRTRVKDLNSPPQLVPTYPTENRENRNNSYPADITNLKEQLRYQSPKHFLPTSNEFTVMCTRDDLVRPTVLTMATEMNDKRACVRSSIDVAEQVLKESRSIYKPGIPILPTDIHPSLFLSRHSSSVSATSSSSLFSPTLPRNSSDFYSTHDSPLPHHIPTQMSLYRHSLQARPEYNEIEKLKEKYRPLSSFSSYHSPMSSRPSSLPVFTSSKGEVSSKSKSFSVESLTNGNKSEKEAASDLPNRVPNMNDRMAAVMPEHLKKYFSAQDRLHIPNGLNGLKRSLDEQLSNHIMERAQRDNKFLDQLHDQRFSPEKHLHEQRVLSDKDRYYHRYPFLDPRSPVRIPGFHPSRTLASDTDRPPLFSSPHISSAYTHYQQQNRYSFPNC